MADLAKLAVTFTADPSPVRKAVGQASKDVQGLANTAKDAAKATDRAFDGVRFPGMSKAAERAERDFQRMEKQMGSVSGASQRMVVEFGKIEAATDGMGRAVVGMNVGLQGFTSGATRVGAAAGAANENIRLTSNQLLNLGRQSGDAATIIAMGASPLMVLSSQAAQVVDALASGPQGVGGSLKAIGASVAAFARSIPAAGYAVAAVTAAVGALWYMTSGPSAREAEATLKDFEDAIKRLETGWKGAADAAREYAKAPGRQASDPNATYLDVRGSIGRLTKDLRAQVNDLNSSDLLSGKILRPFAGSVSDARREISSLYADLRQGEISAQQFADEMLRIRLDPNADAYARNFAEEIRLALGPVTELERKVQALNQAAAQLAAPKGTMGRHDLPNDVFTDRFGPTIGGDGRFGDSEGMNAIRDGLKSQREGLNKTEAATRSYSDAVAEQKASLAGTVAELRLQVDLFGQSEGAIAAARFRLDAMADAQRAANEAKAGAIDPTLVDQINREAAEIGRLTDQLNANTSAQREQTKAAEEAKRQRDRIAEFEGDLAFERSIAGLPDAEQQVRQTLRSLGVDYNSFEGQRLAGEIRYNDALSRSRDAMTDFGVVAENVFGGIIDALGRGGSLVDNLAQAFAGLGKQLASAGLERLLGGLFGGKSGDAKGGGLAAVLAGLGSNGPRIAANANPGGSTGYVPTPTARPEYLGQAAAAVSGQVMTYAKRFNSGVDTRLMAILKEASANFPMRVEAMSGLRLGDPRFHGKGLATDVRIFDANGKALSNYQDGSSFRVYEQFAQQAKIAQEKLFPELGKLFRWGGYFSGAKGRYGALDTMHFDLGGAGMAGGSWEKGLTPAMRRIWGGAESVGMGSRTADQRVVAQGVSQGMMDYSRRAGPEGYGGGRFDDAGAGSMPQMTKGQAGFGALTGLLGIAANGYQSGNILSGGLSGLMGGAELASQFGGALGLGAAAGPIGMGVGAAVGILASPLGRRRENAKTGARRWAQHHNQNGDGRDSDQRIPAA